jgi:hypothetical protein
MKIRHAHQATAPNNPNKEVSATRWNDYTKANGDTSGRKLTIGTKSGIIPVSSGDVTIGALDDGATLLAKFTIPTKTVATSETWQSPAFDVWEITDPTSV